MLLLSSLIPNHSALSGLSGIKLITSAEAIFATDRSSITATRAFARSSSDSSKVTLEVLIMRIYGTFEVTFVPSLTSKF